MKLIFLISTFLTLCTAQANDLSPWLPLQGEYRVLEINGVPSECEKTVVPIIESFCHAHIFQGELSGGAYDLDGKPLRGVVIKLVQDFTEGTVTYHQNAVTYNLGSSKVDANEMFYEYKGRMQPPCTPGIVYQERSIRVTFLNPAKTKMKVEFYYNIPSQPGSGFCTPETESFSEIIEKII